MKIKILLVPFLVCLIIILMIWVVYPAFTSPVSKDGMLEKMTILKTEQGKLDQMNNKSKNAGSLYSELVSGSVKKDVIIKYIPEKAKEEEIIDNLNFIATSEGLSVLGLSVGQDKAAKAPLANQAQDSGTAAQLDASGNPIVVAIKPEASLMTVKYSVTGSYDKIKNVFEKIYKLERFNKVSRMKLSKPASDDAKAEPGDSLQVDAELSFSYLKKLIAIQNLEDPVFMSSKYDMAIADKIQAEKNMSVLNLPSEQSGRSNPFLP